MANKFIYTFLPVDKLAKMNYVEHLIFRKQRHRTIPWNLCGYLR